MSLACELKVDCKGKDRGSKSNGVVWTIIRLRNDEG